MRIFLFTFLLQERVYEDEKGEKGDFPSLDEQPTVPLSVIGKHSKLIVIFSYMDPFGPFFDLWIRSRIRNPKKKILKGLFTDFTWWVQAEPYQECNFL